MGTGALPAARLAAYGALGLPLAFAALPLYIHAPRFFAALGLPLAAAGAILVATRLVDAFIDPWLGSLADRAARPQRFIALALLPLAAGFVALFHPPAGIAPGLWLAVSITIATLGYSAAGIAYQAWGARVGTPADRARVTAFREGFGLIGVILAAMLPQALATSIEAGLPPMALLFPLIVLAAALVTLTLAPRPWAAPPASAADGGFRGALSRVLASRPARRLFGVFMLNGIASAIPATLFLFFAADRLALGARSDVLLAAYFIAAAVSLPLWVALARRLGRAQAWRAGMLLAIAAFAWAFTLGPGDFAPFLAICLATGVALGADLSMPPALLADVIAAEGAEADAGAHFGVWNLINKLNLALAAGFALPLVEWLGYRAGTPADGFALPAVYCLLPCALKLVACVALTRMTPRFATPSLKATP